MEVDNVTALIDLIRFFEAGGCTDAAMVSERYSVSLRKAQRWLVAIERWVPLDRKRSGHRVTVRKAAL